MRSCNIVMVLICAFNLYAADIDQSWLRNYEVGIPTTINADQYGSLTELFEEDFVRYKDLPAYTNMGKTISYAELDEQSKHFASFLQNKLQLAKGERFAIMLPNVLQYPVAMFGVLRAGGTVVSVNPLFTPSELQHQLVDSQATGIIILENFAHTLSAVIDKTQVKHVIVTRVGDVFSRPRSIALNFSVKYLTKMVPAWQLDGHYWFKQVMREGASSTYKKTILTGEDLAFLQYTGGTTGISKGAMLTHRNMVANVLQSSAWLSNLLKPKEEIIITALPMYHIFALTANCLTFMRYGALNVLITNPSDTDSFVDELKKYKFSAITGVNTLFKSLLNHPEFIEVEFSALKFSGAGGMAVQKRVAERWQDLTKRPLLEAYGLTEASPAVCMNPVNLKFHSGSIGVPIPSTEISVRDSRNKELGIGEIGELYVRGPQVMKGYWQQEAETRNVLSTDGWLRTGDIVKVDQDGFVNLVDRKKDLIIVSGFKVYPNQVEAVISAMPGVLEVAIVGQKSAKHGEIVKAFIVKKDPQLTAQAVIDYSRKYLTGYKIPKIVEFRESLPKSNLNKVLKRELRYDEDITDE